MTHLSFTLAGIMYIKNNYHMQKHWGFLSLFFSFSYKIYLDLYLAFGEIGLGLHILLFSYLARSSGTGDRLGLMYISKSNLIPWNQSADIGALRFFKSSLTPCSEESILTIVLSYLVIYLYIYEHALI